jgi:hypothetical protein
LNGERIENRGLFFRTGFGILYYKWDFYGGASVIWLILYGVLSVFLFVMTAYTLKGVDWIIIIGVNTLPKADKQKFKEKHNMVEMNKYAGKRIFLPFSIWALVFAPLILSITLFNAEWMESTWYGTGYGIMIGIFSIIVLISTFSALPKILGNAFEKK